MHIIGLACDKNNNNALLISIMFFPFIFRYWWMALQDIMLLERIGHTTSVGVAILYWVSSWHLYGIDANKMLKTEIPVKSFMLPRDLSKNTHLMVRLVVLAGAGPVKSA